MGFGVLNDLRQIALAVHKAPDFHHVSNHYIKYGIIPDMDCIIRQLPIPRRMIRLEPERITQPLLNGLLCVLDKTERRNGILEIERNIVPRRRQILLKQRKIMGRKFFIH